MQTRYKITIPAIVVIGFVIWFLVDTSYIEVNEKAKEPLPLTLEQMQAMLNQSPREKHQPTHEKGEYPKLVNLSQSSPITTKEDVTNATDPTIRKNSEKLNP